MDHYNRGSNRGWRGGRGRGGRRYRSYHNRDDESHSGAYGGSSYGSGNNSRRYGNNERYDRDEPQEDSGRQKRHPPGLKGREIGMWYASRSKNQTKKREDKNCVLKIDSEKERNLNDLLANIKSSDSCPSQPARSYKDPFEDEEEEEQKYYRYSNNTSRPHTSNSYSKMKMDNRLINDFYNPLSSMKDTMELPSKSDSDFHFNSKSTKTLKQDGDSLFASSLERNAITDESESDSDFDDEKLLQMTEHMERNYVMESQSMEEYNKDVYDRNSIEDGEMEVDTNYGLNIGETEDVESDFMFEFRKHNEENRRSTERLNEWQLEQSVRLQRNPVLDEQLQNKLHEKQQSTRYRNMIQFRKKLPSFNMRKEILDLVYSNQVVVLSGETGCGKTTQVSQFILDDYIERGEGSCCRIVCTQPRRISAISVAERVADERAEKCGESTVGYQIRLDSRLPNKQGSILYCTTGILLQWLASDPLLSKTSHVILDEIHERDLLTDFLMIILRDLLAKRSDLKLILMSATLNAQQFSDYYGGCPMINIPGFTFPVKEYLLEDVIELTWYKTFPAGSQKTRYFGRKNADREIELQNYKQWCNTLNQRYSRKTCDLMKAMDDFEKVDTDLCAELTEYVARNKPDGAILVFLPGWSDIKKLNDLLERRPFFRNKAMFHIIPLHSLMPTVNQRQVFERPPKGVRKIIIATNIAETSITIDDVVYVIDCGKIKMKNFDADNNVQTLNPEWVSKANAKQRRGRAGRVQPGECFHLYSGYHEEKLEDYQLPEILRTRLEELCLHIKLLKLGMVEPFIQKAMQRPSMQSLKQSIQLLRDLNAFDDNEDLTPLGYHLAKMPVDPHSGKMLLYGAMFSCVDPIMTVAASLSFKDAFYVPMGKEKVADAQKVILAKGSQSDHIMLSHAYQGWEKAIHRGTAWQYCRENFLSQQTLKMLSDMRKQFAKLLHEMKFMESPDPKCPSANKNSGNIKLLKAIICAGLFPNVARVISVTAPGIDRPNKLTTKTDRTVVFHPKSVNSKESDFESQWVIYHLKMKIQKVCLFDSTVVSPLALLFFGGDITVAEDSQDNRRKEGNNYCVNIGGHVTLNTNRKTCQLVEQLRNEFDKLLEYKITHPGITDWNPRSKEGALTQAIVDLIKDEVVERPDIKVVGGRKNRDRDSVMCDNCGEKGHYKYKCKYR